MNANTLKLRSEQLIRNRLWRHSVLIHPEWGSGETTEVLATLLDGLRNREAEPSHAYVIVPGGTVDEVFLRAVERAECPRFPLTGRFSGDRDGKWNNHPFVFQLRDEQIVERYVSAYWGRNRFAAFFSPLEPLAFFSLVSRLSLLRLHGESLVWAPFWNPGSFEKRLCESDVESTARLFQHVAFYLREGSGGRKIRIYSVDGP